MRRRGHLVSTLVAVVTLAFSYSVQAMCPAPNAQSFGFTSGLRTFTVPAGVVELTIEAVGAGGGASSSADFGPGLGASMRGDVDVTPGEILKVLVGGRPGVFNGGGGGSYVTRADDAPLVVAGGGGGSGDVDSPSKHAVTSSAGGAGAGSGAGAGGTNGNGATDIGTASLGGGGGLLTDGGDGCCTGAAGSAFVNGGAGGSIGSIRGGFGGGGAGDGFGAGGGGGGYSGGGGGGNPPFGDSGVGGGGGSFNVGRNQVNAAGANGGNGSVTICWEDPPPPVPAIDVQKSTNGVDADDPAAGDAPQISPGAAVSWSYAVSNTGNVPLVNVVVSDDQGVAVTCPGTTLGVSETMNCSASASAADLLSSPFTTVSGICGGDEGTLYRNVATASGEGPAGQSVQDDDPSHYCNPPAPAIDVEKSTNGIDADDPLAGDAPQIAAGESVEWAYQVTNTGNTPLAAVDVTDDGGINVSCPKTELAVGESIMCSALGVAADLSGTTLTTVSGLCGSALADVYENIAEARGESPGGQLVTDSDASHYCNPPQLGITLEKLTNDVDADNPLVGDAPRIEPGTAVTWTYRLTNTGELPLQGVTVSDDQGVSVVCPATTLAVGETMSCSASGLAEDVNNTTFTTVEGVCGSTVGPLYRNVGSVIASAADSRSVQASDVSHYCNPVPSSVSTCSAIEKEISLIGGSTRSINVQRFFSVDPVSCPTGMVVAWAKTAGKVPIEWNHLIGSSYIRTPGGPLLNWTQGAQAIALRGDPADLVSPGEPLPGAQGGATPLLPYDDVAYSQLARVVNTDFRAAAGARGSRITLLDPDVNSPETNQPMQVDLNWWNQAGDSFSYGPLEFRCHMRKDLKDIDPGFELDNLGSDIGQLQIVRREGRRFLALIEEFEPNRRTMRNLFHRGLPSPSTIINTGGMQPGSAVIFPLFDLTLQNGVPNTTVLRISNTFFDAAADPQPAVDVHLMLICGQGDT